MVPDRLWAEHRLTAAAERLARGAPIDRELAAVAARVETSCAEAARRGALPLVLEYPEALPVSAHRAPILDLIRSRGVFVLTGETGSGKTTQLPKMLLEAGYGRRGMIALTQPRRVAAYAMSARIRSETAAAEGVVAHSVRFDDRAGADTLLRVMTDGLLLAEAANDRLLARYEAIIIDEAHERSLNIDLLLGMVRRLRERRPELVVAVSSASIEAERFAAYFASGGSPAPIVAVSGRTFPVEIRYRAPDDEDVGYQGAVVQAVEDIHREGGPGDVLCFLPTERDIIEASRRLSELHGATVLGLFGRLSAGEQQRVFAPARGRKIVLATNIAETSLTIPGIGYVVDAGLARVKRYQASTRTERLPIEPVSQASCLQRAGRAGRVQAGVCVRLFPEDDFAKRDPFTTPEILRSNLAGVALSCLAMGLGEPEDFPWLDAPSPHAWQQARVLLDELGALTDVSNEKSSPHAAPRTPHIPDRLPHAGLSKLGRALAAIPADPQVGRILLAGVDEGVAHEACTISAFLSVQDPRVRPLGQEAKADAAHAQLAHEAGDLATVLRLWDLYQAAPSNSARSRLCTASFLGFRRMREWADVRHQLWRSLRESRVHAGKIPAAGHEPERWPLDRVHRAVLAGMIGNVLMYDREKKAYRGAGDRIMHVHPGSALRLGKNDERAARPGAAKDQQVGKRGPPVPPWLVACEVVETSRLFARLCAPIDPEWVVSIAGDRVKRRHRDPRWNPRRRQVVCTETVTWKGLPVRDGRPVPYERVDPVDATAVFVREALCSAEGAQDLGRDRAFAVVAGNHELFERAARLRHRLRDPALWVDEAAFERCYREKLGLGVAGAPVIASTDALGRWLREHGEDALRMRLADLVPPEAAARADDGFPEELAMGGARFVLHYLFAPGDERDGATLEAREHEVPRIDTARLEWAIPGWIDEIVAAYLQLAPKDVRRALIPLAESARALAVQLRNRVGNDAVGPLGDALRDVVHERFSVKLPPLDPLALPPHCRLRFRIRDSVGGVLYEGRDPVFLAAHAQTQGDRLAALRARWDTVGGGGWPGELPGMVSLHGVNAHVALARARDEQGRVAARRAVYASAEAASSWHDDGLDALLEAAFAERLEGLALAPAPAALAARVEALTGSRHGLLRRQLGVSVLMSVARARIVDEPTWNDLSARARSALDAAAPGFDALLARVADRLEPLRKRLKQGAKSLAAVIAVRAAAETCERLLRPGWPLRLPWSAASRVDSYLEGQQRLLDEAGTRPEDARRAAERAQALVGAWDEAMPGDAARWVMALGLARRARECAGRLEECVLALCSLGAARGAAYAEGELREGLASIGEAVSSERSRCAGMRQELIEMRPIAERAPIERRKRLFAELDAAIAGFPELGLGADLQDQALAIEALRRRIRAGAA